MDEIKLALISGAVLSLAFSYIPGLNAWFAGLESTIKRLIMGGLLLLVALAVYGLACLGWYDVGITCDQAGAVSLFTTFMMALIANQSTYAITPDPKAVVVAKNNR